MEIIMAHLTINYKSSALNMPIMLDVLIPQGRGNYKVLYLLHGAGGDHSSWVLNTRIADYVNTTDIAVVMPSGNNRFYINNIHGKDYYTYAVKELITQCEQWFNISRDPKDRYIAGMSMGGYGAFITPHFHIQVFLIYLNATIILRELICSLYSEAVMTLSITS